MYVRKKQRGDVVKLQKNARGYGYVTTLQTRLTAALSSSLVFLFTLYRWLFVVFFFAQISQNSVALTLTLKTLNCVF